MRVLIAGSLLLAVTPMPAFASENPKEDRMICKRAESFDTGTRLARPKKTCMKKWEWKELQDETDRTMRRVREGGGVDPNAPKARGSSPG